MGLTSLQVCVDSSDWFQGTIQDEQGLDSSSPSGITDSMLACSRPLMERRLRPQHDQALKCPRCDSAHTKFCYYNNYSLTQPRYFCKTCRRYWTKGGTLRNIPVGGGCRKNKKVSSSKRSNSATMNNNNNSNDSGNFHQNHQQNPHFINPNPNPNPNPSHNHNQNHNHAMIMNSTDLQLSYPEPSIQFSASNLFGSGNSSNIPSFMFENLSNNATRAIDFMENGGGFGVGAGTGTGTGAENYMGIMGNSGYANEMSGVNVIGQNYHGSNLCSPFGGMTLDSINNPFMERGLIGYNNNQDGNDVTDTISSLDVKPKLLALEWQDQNATTSNGGGAYMTTGLGSSWGGIMNGYGPSTTNSLV